MSGENFSQLGKANMNRLDAFTNSIEGTQESSQFIDEVLKASQVAVSKDKLLDEAEDNSAIGIQIRTQKLERKKEAKTEKAKQAQESVLVRKEDADGLADGFSQRHGNREYRLDPHLLSQLAEDLGIGIHENSNPEEMISFIRQRMTVDGQSPDVSFVDKAFEFLLEVTRFQLTSATGVAKERFENIYKSLETAKDRHFEVNSVAIQVTQKIIGAVDAVVENTGEAIKDTLTRYRDVVHEQPEAVPTFLNIFKTKGYQAMMRELKGLNAYLGANFKRANLENPELFKLGKVARQMQAVTQVFEQSKSRIRTMESYLSLNGVLAA